MNLKKTYDFKLEIHETTDEETRNPLQIEEEKEEGDEDEEPSTSRENAAKASPSQVAINAAWLSLMDEKSKKLPKSLNISAASTCCSIFRVPPNILKLHPKSFQPSILSIGPYYHGEEHLKMIEEHKWRILRTNLDRLESVNLTLHDLFNAIAAKEDEIRECYSENIDKYSSHKLIEMMILDGGFIVELLCVVNDIIIPKPDDPIRFPWILPSLTRDLLMLENQIPFFVLQILYAKSISDHYEVPSLQELILKLFDHALSRFVDVSILRRKYKDYNGKHILDFYRSTFLPSSTPRHEEEKTATNGCCSCKPGKRSSRKEKTTKEDNVGAVVSRELTNEAIGKKDRRKCVKGLCGCGMSQAYLAELKAKLSQEFDARLEEKLNENFHKKVKMTVQVYLDNQTMVYKELRPPASSTSILEGNNVVVAEGKAYANTGFNINNQTPSKVAHSSKLENLKLLINSNNVDFPEPLRMEIPAALLFRTEDVVFYVYKLTDINEMFNIEEANVSLIHMYILYLYEEYKLVDGDIKFLCPEYISAATCQRDQNRVTNYIKDAFLLASKKKKKACKYILAPYVQDHHWILFVIDLSKGYLYMFDPLIRAKDLPPRILTLTNMIQSSYYVYQGLKGITECKDLVIKPVQCAQQTGHKECGYYVMRYMLEIVTSQKKWNVDLDAAYGSARKEPYIEELGEIQEQCATFYIKKRPSSRVENNTTGRDSTQSLSTKDIVGETPTDNKKGSFQFIQPVEKLREAGIKFKKQEDQEGVDSFLDIKYREGVLEIPCLTTSEMMSTLLLNCIAFEQCYRYSTKHFTSYFNFMGYLINTSLDAQYLRKKKIIENFFGTDQELVSFFNEVGKNIPYFFEEDYLMETCKEVEIYYRNVWNVRCAECWFKCCGSPLLIWSACAAILLILLSMMQGVLALYKVIKGSS